jgi:hypothetical protein
MKTLHQPELGYLIRCEARRYSVLLDQFDNYGTSAPRLEVKRFPILRRTQRGAWIDVWGDKRFVLLTARKQYASETEEEAKQQFIHRKRRQIKILASRLRDAKEDLALAVPDSLP